MSGTDLVALISKMSVTRPVKQIVSRDVSGFYGLDLLVKLAWIGTINHHPHSGSRMIQHTNPKKPLSHIPLEWEIGTLPPALCTKPGLLRGISRKSTIKLFFIKQGKTIVQGFI